MTYALPRKLALFVLVGLLPACGSVVANRADSGGDAGAAPDAAQADGGKTGATRGDAARGDMAAPDAARGDAAGADALGVDAAKLDATSPDARGADAAASACRQTLVVLGAAADFAVLAGPTVTNTGLTKVVGDLGVSPGTAITGFPPGSVVGLQHAGDPTAAQAEADLEKAYADAAARTLCPTPLTGNLGGKTLLPGLYTSTTSLEISAGDLTLDAAGDPDAVFVFQMTTTLITTSARQVHLSGSAKAANVFWQVGSSATLGMSSLFEGTIMAAQSITLDTGATLEGRALARIAAITLDSNSITRPVP
jgi:Ice-binding-like